MNIKYVIVDERINPESENKLKELGYIVIKLEKCKDVYDEIGSHVDIQMIKFDDKLIVAKNITKDFLNKLDKYDIKWEYGDSEVGYSYPSNIMYNACIVGKYFIHNIQYTDKKVLDYAINKGYEIVNVNQGYTKCSISIVDDNSIITSDTGIVKALKDKLDILYINPDENIRLGKLNGFIGGATGLLKNNIWAINGNIDNLNEKDKIINFIKSKNINIVSLNNSDIIDIGTILTII